MSKVVDKLLNNLNQSQEKPVSGEKIKVNRVISSAAFVYEKIRMAVDYNEDHLVRKNAIFRILKRKLMIEKMIMENYILERYHHENVAEQLLQELLRAKYVNKDISVEMIGTIDEIIQKYNFLFSKIKEQEGKVENKLFNQFLEICAVEIEQTLIPPVKDKALVNAMFSIFNSKIQLIDGNIDEKEKELQILINSYRALFKWDNAMISYLLLNLYYPSWENAQEDIISQVANNISKIRNEISKQINHPWKKQILKILQKKAIIFWIIEDVWEANQGKAEDIFNNQEKLQAEVKKAIQKRYKGVGVKLRRGVIRSIIYVFFTKMLLAIALEFPMDFYLMGEINYNSAAINIFFPPILMLLVAIMIRMPKKENTNQIITDINEIAFKGSTKVAYELKAPRRHSKTALFIFQLIYSLTFVFSIMCIFWLLNKLDFNVFSSLIFVLFLTLVSFFGIRIRKPVKEIMTIEKRESLIGSVVDFFALPFVSMGRWMSTKFSKINFIAFLLDVIIEAPFKLLIQIFEDMFGFIKEKKEDVMSE